VMAVWLEQREPVLMIFGNRLRRVRPIKE